MIERKHHKFFLAGGAGFIGSQFLDVFLASADCQRATIYDNFSSGQEWHYAHHLHDWRLNVIRGNVEDTGRLASAMQGHDVVLHLASNPDIARAAAEPRIDFDQGTALTQSVVEAMRVSKVRRLLYASGSGVYGDLGELEAAEDYSPLSPVSTYGASKLAGEALISAYCSMFELTGCAFRFGNVVGPRQTHGVGFDFLRNLAKDPACLTILGDGSQSKSYVHVSDVVRAVLLADSRAPEPFAVYNVATGDYITVAEIAELAVECAGLPRGSVRFQYTGGNRGWKGDVPIVRLNTGRITALGWSCSMPTREALRASMMAMAADQQWREAWTGVLQ